MPRTILTLMLTLFAALLFAPATPAAAVPQLPPIAPDARTRCFAETGHCVSDPILRYWERNGGVAVFGYPISPLSYFDVEGGVVPAQWFERDRLEDHGAAGKGVLAGRLGARLLELQGRPWERFATVGGAPAGCRYFPQTRHSLCQPFLGYWERNGGLERFGYPLSEPLIETIGGWTGTVQYFERRRMEHHTEYARSAYEILLGLLGAEVFDATYSNPAPFPAPAPAPHNEPWPAPLSDPSARCLTSVLPELRGVYSNIGDFRTSMGCPLDTFGRRPAALQEFQGGTMLWTDLNGLDKRIYAVLPFGGHRLYADSWREGDPQPLELAPAGLYTPQRGFGKVWGNDQQLRSELGYATQPNERAATATIQLFEAGAIVWVHDTETVYVFGPAASQTIVAAR